MLPTAIVLGVDTPIGLTVVRELGERDVRVHGVGRTANSLGRSSRYCKTFSLRPDGLSLSNWLPELIVEVQARALFAISEGDLIGLSSLPEVIQGCHILTPRSAQLDIVLNKTRSLDIAARLGLDVPHSWQPRKSDDFHQIAASLDYPVVAKWSDANFAHSKLKAHGLSFEKAEFLFSPEDLLNVINRYAPIGVWPMVQSYCSGRGLGQMLCMVDGKAVLRFQHERVHEWPPEGGVSTFCVAQPLRLHDDQMLKSEALLRAIAWEGPAMVEYRYDPKTRRYLLMEINGRFWGSLPLAYHCGVHFAWEMYRRHILGEDVTRTSPSRLRRARYMIPETRRLFRIVMKGNSIRDPAFQRRPVSDVVSYFTGFLDPKMRYYVLSLSDPKPWVTDLVNVVRSVPSRLVQRTFAQLKPLAWMWRKN